MRGQGASPTGELNVDFDSGRREPYFLYLGTTLRWNGSSPSAITVRQERPVPLRRPLGSPILDG